MDQIEAWMDAAGGFLAFLYVLVLVLVPVSLYSCQKWCYRSFRELQKIRKALEK